MHSTASRSQPKGGRWKTAVISAGKELESGGLEFYVTNGDGTKEDRPSGGLAYRFVSCKAARIAAYTQMCWNIDVPFSYSMFANGHPIHVHWAIPAHGMAAITIYAQNVHKKQVYPLHSKKCSTCQAYELTFNDGAEPIKVMYWLND